MSIESGDSAAKPSAITGWWTPRLAGPLIAAAVVRLTLLVIALTRFGPSGVLMSDTQSYLEPGRNLLLHGSFMADGVPDLVRTPGYSIFLAIFSFAGIPAAAVANLIVSVFCVLLVWKLARTCFSDDRIALYAAWIFAFEPISILYSFVLLSEPLFLALLLLGMERLAVFLRVRRLPVLAVAGLWIAAATFVRPISYCLPVALALGLFLVLVHVPGARWKAPAVLLVSTLPWIAAWQVRNWVETDYRGFSSIREVDLYFQLASGVTAVVEHRNYDDVRASLGYSDFAGTTGQMYLSESYLARHPEQTGWSQSQRLDFMHSEANRIIRAHFGVYLRTGLISLTKTVFIFGERAFDHLLYPEDSSHEASSAFDNQARWGIVPAKTNPRITAERIAFAAMVLGLYFFAALGVYRGGIRNMCFWLLLGISIYFLAIIGVGEEPGGNARYRIPIMPMVCIFAAVGIRRAKIPWAPSPASGDVAG